MVCDIIKEIEKDIKEIARMENRLLELKKEQKSLQPNQRAKTEGKGDGKDKQ